MSCRTDRTITGTPRRRCDFISATNSAPAPLPTVGELVEHFNLIAALGQHRAQPHCLVDVGIHHQHPAEEPRRRWRRYSRDRAFRLGRQAGQRLVQGE